ncbi:hypothetical protein LWI29_020778 [Acer saccharum]|uniref:Uncharacterized protein n=1 Tax=Acer saccharum TaxID=4024 RepID=A0AA39V260_ACESA|nr:hypothetical protein LWI29_020778 [Acer saccharum]
MREEDSSLPRNGNLTGNHRQSETVEGHYELLVCFNNTATYLQNNCVGTESIEKDELSQDKGDDNVGMEDKDIAGELERNLEQVSDTHMIDLEPLPSGPSKEKVK